MPGNNCKVGWLPATWPAPAHIHAGTTTRTGGSSPAPYDSFNLADHVGDHPAYVVQNRKVLCDGLGLVTAPSWLHQQHGNRIIDIATPCATPADGASTTQRNRICVVLTADCLPLLLCDAQGTQIAAIHVGWRGFCKNIIARAIAMFSAPVPELLAWLGPCISRQHYEVGAEVRSACTEITGDPDLGFARSRKDHWYADLVALARSQLHACGIKDIYGGEYCTFARPDLFYSYRRDGVTGRMASLIWME